MLTGCCQSEGCGVDGSSYPLEHAEEEHKDKKRIRQRHREREKRLRSFSKKEID